MADDLEHAWTALRQCLESRSRALHDELRSYPTPIARCDEQLTGLIEQRDTAFRQLRTAADLERVRSSIARAEWLTHLRGFVATLEGEGDSALATRARVVAAAVAHS